MRRFPPVVAALSSAMLLAGTPAALADAWRALPIQPQAHVVKVVVAPADPARLLAWTGILYRSYDAGASWEVLPGHLDGDPRPTSLGTLALDPLCPEMAWAAVRNRIFQSTDFGATWAAWGTPPPADRIVALVPNVGSLLSAWVATAGGSAAGVYRTTDGGTTWVPRSTGLSTSEVHSLAVRPGELTTLVAGTTNGLARTTDGGESWLFASAGDPADHVAWSNSGAIVRARQGGLVQSTDSGETWSTLRGELGQGDPPYASDPEDTARLLISDLLPCVTGWFCHTYGYEGSIVRSTDGGGSWAADTITSCETIGGWTQTGLAGGVALRGNRAWNWLPAIGSSARSILRSVDGGLHWTPSVTGMSEAPIGKVGVDVAGDLFVRSPSWSDVSWRSTDRGASWQHVHLRAQNGAVFEVARDRTGDLLDAGWSGDCDVFYGTASRTTDGGATWIPTDGCPNGLPGDTGAAAAAFDYGAGSVIYLWLADPYADDPTVGTLYRSDDGNLSYSLVGETFLPRNAWITPEDADRVFALARSGDPVRLSTDGGDSWTSRSAGLPPAPTVRLLMDAATGEHLLVAFERGVPWETTNGGRTWAPLASDTALLHAPGAPAERPLPPSFDLREAVIRDADWDVASGQRRVFLATDRGVWISDAGFVDEGLPRLAFDRIAYSKAAGLVVAGAGSFGAFALEVPPLTAGRIPSEVGAGPSNISSTLLLAPNPFAQFLRVQFALPSSDRARLEIFDSGGRRVHTVVDTRLSAGSHTFLWNARDGTGRPVAPGVYFVRLERGNAMTTGRAVLLR